MRFIQVPDRAVRFGAQHSVPGQDTLLLIVPLLTQSFLRTGAFFVVIVSILWLCFSKIKSDSLEAFTWVLVHEFLYKCTTKKRSKNRHLHTSPDLVTGNILLSVHMRNISVRSSGIKFEKQSQHGATQAVSFATIVALSNPVTLIIKPIRILLKLKCIQGKIMPFWPLCCENEAILPKKVSSPPEWQPSQPTLSYEHAEPFTKHLHFIHSKSF